MLIEHLKGTKPISTRKLNLAWWFVKHWRTFYLLIDVFVATDNLDDAKELVVLLWLSGNI